MSHTSRHKIKRSKHFSLERKGTWQKQTKISVVAHRDNIHTPWDKIVNILEGYLLNLILLDYISYDTYS